MLLQQHQQKQHQQKQQQTQTQLQGNLARQDPWMVHHNKLFQVRGEGPKQVPSALTRAFGRELGVCAPLLGAVEARM
jgi:hypothetical protein